MNKQEPVLDYKALADGADDLRELLSILVTAVMAEGFDEVQARAIVAGMLGVRAKGDFSDE